MSTPARIDPATRRVSLDATDPAFYQNPYAAFEAIHAKTPVFFWEELGMWCLTGYDAVNGVFRDSRFGREILHVATREELGWPEPPEHVRRFYEVDNLSMIAREPPVHTRLRGLVNRAFVSRNVERLRPRVAALAEELIDRFQDAGECDLIAAWCEPIPVSIIAELLGVPSEEAPRLVDWSHRMVAMYTPGRNRPVEDAAGAATEEFVAFLRSFVEERRKAPRDDLISHLIAAEAAGDRLSEDELIAGTIQLLNAGHEATVHSLDNAVKAILESSQSPAAFFATDKSTAATAEEALRFDPPLHFFDRYALADVEVADVRLRKGEKIGLILAAANRDPARWENPEKFDPSRPLLANISFGAGIPFLHRRAARPPRDAGGAADPVSTVAEAPPCRDAALSQRLAFSWAEGAAGRMVTHSRACMREAGSQTDMPAALRMMIETRGSGEGMAMNAPERTAKIIDGKAVAASVVERVKEARERLVAETGVTPSLATVLVGEDPASRVYVANKSRTAKECGFHSEQHTLSADMSEAELLALIARLNADPAVHGILVQLPLPKQINEGNVLLAVDSDKDVDGFHPINVGRLASGARDAALVPCTPAGSVILAKHALGENLVGLEAVVVGRSNIVGKPVAQLLLAEHCTVTICHSRTRDLASVCRRGDILVAAVGRAEMVKGDWVKPGACVIDVGINRVPAPEKGEGKTKLVGDVDFAAASRVAGSITPVPGGVGPMTIAMLMANTLIAAARKAGRADIAAVS